MKLKYYFHLAPLYCSNSIASEREGEVEAESEENLEGITGRQEQHGMTMMTAGGTEWKRTEYCGVES
jgi:hypothetical protein